VKKGDKLSTENVLKAMKEAGKPVRPGDIAKTLGVESKEVSKAIKELRKEGKVHSPKRCYYAPTE
jgi:Mn-dependent DtxR family transcriptional regulator